MTITLSIPGIAADDLPLEEQAYRRLRQALVEGVFAPGEKLSIRRVAEALGTSPMPARTALRRLATEQALDALPSGTVLVPRLTRAAFQEVSAIRAELEPLAIRLAASRVDSGTLDALAAVVAEQDAARAAGRPELCLQKDREFLFGLYRQAGAPMLLGMIEALWLRRGPLFWEARWIVMGSPPEAAHRHGPILAALRRGAGEEAARELKAEIERMTAFLSGALQFEDEVPAMPRAMRARA
ncbi:GntR family transcriptional regulator [Belnapia sp. F-4-1]|uniref:GntR family transcriptional regulator n=1 Tax=Belnapia sp. F-4-1 TaxID=1545443 RepID=UPI0006902C50|nr:GntR family transcriptional regulator [Belnapia sp. F-4-1]